MNKKTKSILQELTTFRAPEEDVINVIETRAMHVIKSAISLIEEIEDNSTDEEAELLTKRFYSSIRNSDENRFSRAIRNIKEKREKNDE